MFVERFVLDIIEGKRKSFFLLTALRFLGHIYGLIIAVRNFLYDQSILKTHKANAFVVSIGNIVCGGTGKTPFLCMLASELKSEVKIAVLTRGFRSSMEKRGAPKQISSNEKILFSPQLCGDEPFLIASHTGCSVFVGKDRVESARMASSLGYSVLLLDDGMQHRRLYRDIEIVLLDARDPWGRGAYVPGGLLRDSPSRLMNADLVVIGNSSDDSVEQKLIDDLRAMTKASIITVKRKFSLPLPSGVKVGMFCGIAKPQYFEEALKSSGYDVVDRLITADHVIPTPENLESFASRCKQKGAVALVCTEKDYVKLKNCTACDLPILFLKMEMYVASGNEVWNEYIKKIVAAGKAC